MTSSQSKAQFDSWQLSHTVENFDGIDKAPKYTAAQTAYAVEYAAETQRNLTQIVAGSAGLGIMSRACYNHHNSEHTLFWSDLTTGNVSQGRPANMHADSYTRLNVLAGTGGMLRRHPPVSFDWISLHPTIRVVQGLC